MSSPNWDISALAPNCQRMCWHFYYNIISKLISLLLCWNKLFKVWELFSKNRRHARRVLEGVIEKERRSSYHRTDEFIWVERRFAFQKSLSWKSIQITTLPKTCLKIKKMNEINRFYLKYGKFLIRFWFRFRERAISRCCFYITLIFFAYQIYQIWFFKKFHSDQDITKIYKNDLIIKLDLDIYLVATEANRSLPTVMTG